MINKEYHVKLSPLIKTALPARLRPTDGEKPIYVVFAPGDTKIVDKKGLEDLRNNYTMTAKWTSREANEAITLGLTHTRIHGCSSCAKKRKIDPKLMRHFVFRKFVVVDPETNELIKEELLGEVGNKELRSLPK